MYIKGKKTLSVQIPADLYGVFAKLCLDHEISKTEGIVRYIKWLNLHHRNNRKLLDEKNKIEGQPFNMDEELP